MITAARTNTWTYLKGIYETQFVFQTALANESIKKRNKFSLKMACQSPVYFSVDHFYTYLQIAAQSQCLLFAIKFDFLYPGVQST